MKEIKAISTMENYNISIIVEHGYPHYKITDKLTGSETHCDMNELEETINEISEELRGVNYEKRKSLLYCV